jgi:spore coat protein A
MPSGKKIEGVTVNDVVLTPGTVTPPDAYELGRKDTAICPPGIVTRVLVNFPNRTGKYVYHCHILSHEDSEMMRFYEVKDPAPAAV